jgi:hypothetical protein
MHDLDHPVLAGAKNTDNAGDASDASDDGVDDHEASDGAAVVEVEDAAQNGAEDNLELEV